MDEIEALRRRYDPLAGRMPAHITLVFPFTSDLGWSELQLHIAAVARAHAPVPIRMQGVTGQDGEYLFLNIKQGNDALIALHDALYSGPLARHLNREHTFIPHLTVGRLANRQDFLRALGETAGEARSFEGWVSELSVYSIEEEGRRPVELTVALSG